MTSQEVNQVDEAKAAFLALNSANNAAAPRGQIPNKVMTVIGYLDKNNPDHYITQKTLVEYIGCSGGRIFSLVNQLVKDGVLRVDDTVKPHRYYPA